jgi:chemotaxis protein MotA
MDIGPLVGIGFALLMILLGNTLEGGHIHSILGGPAFMIVIGGTIGAVMVQFPLATCAASLKSAGALFKKSHTDLPKLVDEIVGYADKARRDGVLALEKVAATASDPFLGRALMMAVDGADSATLRDTMEVSMDQEHEHSEDHAKVFEAAGGYCPTVGIIGAVLGLIHVMSNLADINAVGSGIAAAFVATIYGVAAANIIFLPFAGRIKMQLREHMLAKQMMLSGVLAIQEGTNPKLVRERLNGYLQGHDKGKAGAAKEATA